MELSNLIWHLGAFVFALWAAVLAVKAKRRSQSCVEALLPVLFADASKLSREQLRSAGARIYEFFEQEISTAAGLPCIIVKSPLLGGTDLQVSVSELWQLLPQSVRFSSLEPNLHGGPFEYEGTRFCAASLLQKLGNASALAQTRHKSSLRLVFNRVTADASFSDSTLSPHPFWRVAHE